MQKQRKLALAVNLPCQRREVWPGWMGIEPTQDASTAPRKQLTQAPQDQGVCGRGCAVPSTLISTRSLKKQTIPAMAPTSGDGDE